MSTDEIRAALVARMIERAEGGCEGRGQCCCDPDEGRPLDEWCDVCLIGAAAHELRDEPYAHRALRMACRLRTDPEVEP